MKDIHRGITIKCYKCKTILQDESEFGCTKCLKPKVTKELIKKHAVHMSVNSFYDADDQKQGTTPIFEHPRVENALVKFLKEAGYEVEK